MLKELLAEIKECDEARKGLEERRASLVHRVQSMKTKAALVLKRFESGDYVVNSSGRHFWVNNGELLRAVYADEMQGLEELVRMKVITK